MQNDNLEDASDNGLSDQEMEEMVNQEDQEIFDNISELIDDCQYNEVIEVIRTLPTEKAKYIIHLENNWLFEISASRGRLELLNLLVELTPDKELLDNMLTNYAFHSAAINNHGNIIKRMVELTSNQERLNEMVHQYNNSPFFHAAKHGNVDLLNYYYTMAKDEEHFEIMKEANYGPFVAAIESGNIEAVKFFTKLFLSKPQFEEMLHILDNKGFIIACEKGDVDIVKYLLELSKSNYLAYEKMLHTRDNQPFISAVKNNHSELVQYFLELVQEQTAREKMIHAQENAPFIHSIKNGHINMAKLLLELTDKPEKKKEMIHAQSDAAFVGAVGNQQIEAVHFLLNMATDEEKEQMFHAGYDGAFKILTARDMSALYHDPKHNYYAKNIATDYSEEDQKLYPITINEFLKYDCNYFSQLFYKICEVFFVSPETEKCIITEINKYNNFKEHNWTETIGEFSKDES